MRGVPIIMVDFNFFSKCLYSMLSVLVNKGRCHNSPVSWDTQKYGTRGSGDLTSHWGAGGGGFHTHG